MYRNEVIDNMRLDGGSLCLDFVNTIPDRVDGTNRDHLQNFSDLLYWAKKAGTVDSIIYTALERAAGSNERKSKDFFHEAIALRDLIYSIFHPITQQRKVKPTDLETFNKISSRYYKFLELRPVKGHFVEYWNLEADDFLNITASIVKSARDLLLLNKTDKIKECSNCGWLFLDTTKNGKRRWCSMEDCGSNVKAREYYHRNKENKLPRVKK
jgi:predicted RNA-binding Zn ribbon-like protein